MIFMAKFPRKDDVDLEIENSREVGEINITLSDNIANQEMTYTLDVEDLKLALRKLSCK